MGRYLDRLAAKVGYSRPIGAGVPDNVLRDILRCINLSQTTNQSLNLALEAFYGIEKTHAGISSLPEPFSLQDGDQLLLEVDGRHGASVTFSTADFADIAAVTAIEAAAVINRWFGIRKTPATAVPVTDPESGLTHLSLLSNQAGLGGSIKLTGGIGWRRLWFHNLAGGDPGAMTWVTTRKADKLRFSVTTSDNSILNNMRDGDAAVVVGTFSTQNRGSFTISNSSRRHTSPSVVVYSFDLNNPIGVAETKAVPNSQIYFFRSPVARLSQQSSAFTKPSGNGVDIILPAITQVVSRDETTAGYLANNALTSGVSTAVLYPSSDIVRLQLPFSSSGMFSVGDWVLIDGVGMFSGIHQVTAVNGILHYIDFSSDLPGTGASVILSSTGATITKCSSVSRGTQAGCVLTETAGGLKVTSSTTLTTSDLSVGWSGSLPVADSTQLPDQAGWLVIGYGYEYQTAPIYYLGRQGSLHLLLDPSAHIKAAIPAGSSVNLLTDSGIRNSPASCLRTTNSAMGRIAASQLLRSLGGTAIEQRHVITYPGDRGLAGEGRATMGSGQLSDIVTCLAGDFVDEELARARES
jgi:hypothetical protein